MVEVFDHCTLAFKSFQSADAQIAAALLDQGTSRQPRRAITALQGIFPMGQAGTCP